MIDTMPEDVDINDLYLVRAFGGELEWRIKPNNGRMAGRHNPETGVRDL